MVSEPVWHGLLANSAVLVIFVAAAVHSYGLRATWPEVLRAASLGVLFGIGAVALMLFPVELRPGLFSDLRAVLIALAGFFGGPIAGVLAAGIAVASRLLIGGEGALTGALGIALVSCIGLTGWLLLARRRIRSRDVVILGAWTAVGGVATSLLLPTDLRDQVLSSTAFPQVLLVFGATVLAGLAMLQERQRQQMLKESRVYRAIIESLPDSLNVKDREGRFIVANEATAKLMGADSAADLIGHTDFDFYSRATAEAFRSDEERVLELGGPVTLEQEFRRSDGEKVWLSTLKVPVAGSDGTPTALITHNRDVSQRKRLEADLAVVQQRLATALDHMSDGLAMFDPEGRLLFCNEQYRTIFAKTADVRVPGTPLRTILRASVERGEQLDVPSEQLETWIESVMRTLRTASEQEVQRFDGAWLHIRSNPLRDGSAVVTVSDITSMKKAETQLKVMAAQLRVLATTDGLTGLMNRRTLDESLERELARSRRTGTPISLILIDVDRFKAFNDLYGHPTGDACLRRVATLLQSVVRRPADIVARYGGEELAVVLPETDEDGAYQLAESYRRAVRDLQLEHAASEKGIVTVSVGVAAYTAIDSERSAGDLLSRADEALYRAKRAGRDRVEGTANLKAAGAG